MRKLIDDRGRLFGKISILDIVVLLVAVVLVVAFYAKFNVHDTPMSSRDTTQVTYTVRIPAIRLSSANLLRSGDKLYSSDTGGYIGTITDIEITDAIAPDSLVDGTYAIARVEERYDVLLTVTGYCSVSNGRVYVDRTFELSANGSYKVFTKYNDFSSCILMSIDVD